ncbi:virulence factor [Deerpox virus W-1170-84]|uniref:Virulence factor n=1 Tax=Deerpox virus (strain W-1170-84) TaxID=305676 RepID=Q08F24_DPV84|nr:virulence factor [Deerpox virus W-1170-84]AYC44696.1 virulence factor [Moosepox virus GoldyGopher14]
MDEFIYIDTTVEKNIVDILKYYITWRGSSDFYDKHDCGKIFKKLMLFDDHARKIMGDYDYLFIKNMNLSLDDGPRLDKIDNNILSKLSYKELIGLCAVLAEKVVHYPYTIKWEKVFNTLFDRLTNEDFTEIKTFLNKT